ncbi:UDP-N-acetylglucosamine 1-carboxyvinyltransferase isoform 2 [Hibiscus syriacus]|uniref:UDP-N-acetylglucosamine 1-carboxyvinyltransferase n=1 Tax=Hibiscus syriacus TaxID=106335 RepID=A0A6A3CWG6_HIBSY|nr:UDP-N-acetylglucosamine 1-carboxyvinyltransferase isoform 2 [Hibiscus syriacus]
MALFCNFTIFQKPFVPSCSSQKTQFSNTPQNTNQDTIFKIKGPATLSGHVTISGSKNSSLALLAATLCCSGSSLLHNVPNISDIQAMASILSSLGAKVESFDGKMMINSDGVGKVEVDSEEMKKIRGGFFVIGPLLARFGEVVVALPGGCDIGKRPVDLHLRGLRALGSVVELRQVQDGKVWAHAANGKGLVGGRFQLDYPSVGATATLMMAASMADGITVLLNVAKVMIEGISTDVFVPDYWALIKGAGTDTLVIWGKSLYGSECVIRPDRIEASTFMIAAAITRSCISMSPVIPSSVSCLIDKLSEAGCKISQLDQHILRVSAVPAYVGDDLKSFGIKTSPFPGFPTDLQPQIMALLTTCNGSSLVEESVFDNRMTHARELQKLSARIQVSKSSAVVFGKDEGSSLCGSPVTARDLRGGASLILAGLAAKGTTVILKIEHIERGYEKIDTKLQILGADIERLTPLPVLL